jgi:hypothetical protein
MAQMYVELQAARQIAATMLGAQRRQHFLRVLLVAKCQHDRHQSAP